MILLLYSVYILSIPLYFCYNPLVQVETVEEERVTLPSSNRISLLPLQILPIFQGYSLFII